MSDSKIQPLPAKLTFASALLQKRIPPWEQLKMEYKIKMDKETFYLIDQNSYHSVYCEHYDGPRRALLLEFKTIPAQFLYHELKNNNYC